MIFLFRLCEDGAMGWTNPVELIIRISEKFTFDVDKSLSSQYCDARLLSTSNVNFVLFILPGLFSALLRLNTTWIKNINEYRRVSVFGCLLLSLIALFTINDSTKNTERQTEEILKYGMQIKSQHYSSPVHTAANAESADSYLPVDVVNMQHGSALPTNEPLYAKWILQATIQSQYSDDAECWDRFTTEIVCGCTVFGQTDY